MKVEIVQARVSHIPHIAARIRPADEVELWDFACVTPAQAMYHGLNQARIAKTGFINGEAVAMFGCNTVSAVSGVGRPWLIGTDLLDKYPKTFLRRCRPGIEKMFADYKRLENYIDVRNVKAIAWLTWLGFEMGEPEPMGLYKKPFIKFHKGEL
jgi:hypothetical protein